MDESPEDDFDALPARDVLRAFGVDYAHVRPREGGDLYLTRFGWSLKSHLMPAQWYADRWYVRSGERLLAGTGTVYRVRTRPIDGASADVVVKFSRMAQDVPVLIPTTFPADMPPEVIAEARVNSPVEEIGLLMELRGAHTRDGRRRMLTQRPLAIYAPPEEFDLWQLGRDESRFHFHRRSLEDDQGQQPKAIELDIRRIYVLLYGWVAGRDAEEVHVAGELSAPDMERLSLRVTGELSELGYRVLDNKPKHFILRRRRHGELLRRRGELAYALVDFEFLQRTPEHQRRFRLAQRQRYWSLLRHNRTFEADSLALDLRASSYLGTPYVLTATPDGGLLWVVGSRGELCDYFAPERWRRTPRTKLSPTNEVYSTRTRDGIHFVYRRSRFGMLPACDPLTPAGKRIRAYGYNSPFEEVAIARRLQAAGIPTVHPRAVYRTAHRSTTAAHLRDERRFRTHAHLTTPGPDPEPLLSPVHDYYTIWGYFRGIDPHGQDGPAAGVVGLREAESLGLLDGRELAAVTDRLLRRLRDLEFPHEKHELREFAVVLGKDGSLQRKASGDLIVVTTIDLNTAFDHGLLAEPEAHHAIERFGRRIADAGFDKLDMTGTDLLLTMQADASLVRDDDGELRVTLCNVELVQPIG